MSAMLLMLATTTVGVDWGYRPLPGGGLEYIIQIEPRVLDTLAGGREVVSTVPSSLRDVRRYRVTIGTQRLPRGGNRSAQSQASERARGVHTRWRSIHSGAYEHVIELDPSAVDKMRREMDLVDDVRNVRRFRIRVRRGPEPTPVERGPIEPRPLAVSAPLRPVANPATDESAPARTFKEPEPTGEEKPKERSVIDRPAVAEPNPQPVEPEPGPVEPQEEPEPQDEPAGFELPDPLEDAPADPEPEVDAQPVAEPEIMEPMDPPANPEPNEPFPWPEAVPEPGAEKPVVEIPPVEKPVEEKPAGGTTPVPDEWPPTSPTEFPPIANPIEESQENVTPPAENAADKDEFNPFPLPSDPWPETPPPASEAASPPFAESTADPEPFPPTSELTSSLSNESPPSEPSPPEEADEGPEPPTKPRMASAAVNDDDKPWWALTTALFVLFASLGGNAYLGWINWGMRREYASLLAMLKQQRGGDRA